MLTSAWSVATAEDLHGLVLCGYQGWFRCEADGSNNGWHHYAVNGKFEPGFANIDQWPDVSELSADEKFQTPFRLADGRVAEVFSSVKPATVRRHFRWMREYGIDGVFLQRFAVSTHDPYFLKSMDQVLENCRSSANQENRNWALMYDMSGELPEHFHQVIDDWKRLHQTGRMNKADPAYLKLGGKPIVALWGLGFSDRPPALREWEELLRFFRSEGCAVMVGVPCYWRTLDRDAISNPQLHALIAMADIVSPWAVGRFSSPTEAAKRVESLLKPDIAWCRERKIGYLPVAFPGFSWHNLQKSRGRDEPLDAIPRQGGTFLWSQAVAVKQAGLDSLYVAMFDEMDEGTAIFKTSRETPLGASPFLSEAGTPPDHYLWLTGEIGRFLRDGKSATENFPVR